MEGDLAWIGAGEEGHYLEGWELHHDQNLVRSMDSEGFLFWPVMPKRNYRFNRVADFLDDNGGWNIDMLNTHFWVMMFRRLKKFEHLQDKKVTSSLGSLRNLEILQGDYP